MSRTSLGALTTIVAALNFLQPHVKAHELSVGERVKAQQAIEQVYWEHKIWPKENTRPKPPLSEVMPSATLRARVEDYLAKSNAIERWWHRPISRDQLQAELDRMVTHSHDRGLLRELFAALGDDPRLIAEVLARQTLADRLIRGFYASDTRFHGPLRATAETALAACASVDCMKSMGGEYRETTWRLDGSVAHNGAQHLGAEEWNALRLGLATKLGGSSGALPVQRLSGLEETSEGFIVTAVLSQSAAELTTATTVWSKRSFDAWWAAEAATVGSRIDEPSGLFVLPAMLLTACTIDTWTPTSLGTNVPAERYSHTAVWTGTEMIVWGGQSASGYLNSGGRYNPATDSWTAISTGTNGPTARAYHTAVWTGAEMIVWGGYGGAYLNTGGRYNPSTDTWTPTSTAVTVPSERFHHTAVWTGTRMIVWGGTSPLGGDYLSSGGQYDPSTDTWTPTSFTPVSERSSHTAVWTGTEMIVWGGKSMPPGSNEGSNDGGRYNPATGAWSRTSLVNAPERRFAQTAVWTGTEMIVWGGQYFDWVSGTSVNRNTGGRYDPSTNTWSLTSTGENVPSARVGHTAVWAGTEMIAWGGGYNTGGRYDPATNLWTPTSTGTHVPTARSSHTAVWTGMEMIVWGGASVNTGGRYCVCPTVRISYRDADGDGYGDPGASNSSCDGSIPSGYVANELDCNDADAGVWSIPSGIRSLVFSSKTVLGWTAPLEPGGTTLRYDTIRSSNPSDFTGGTCVESNGVDTTSPESSEPPVETVFFFLVRAETTCGTGTLGTRSSGVDRSGRDCP